MNQQLFPTVFIVVLSLIVLTNVEAAKERPKPAKCNDKNQRNADLNMAKLVSMGKNGRNFPNNTETLKTFCSETTKLIARIESYTKSCYEKSLQNTVSIFVYTIRNTVRQYCGKKLSSRSKKLINASNCLNEHIRNNDKCLVNFNDRTRALIPTDDDAMKIPYSCCIYIDTMNCYRKQIASTACAAKDEDLLMEFMTSLFTPLVDLLCGDYNPSTNRCDSVIVPKGDPSYKENSYYSFVFVLIDLLQSMKGFHAFS